MSDYILYNSKLILFDRVMSGGIEITGNHISNIFCGVNVPQDENAQYIDCNGMYVSPGFIDIHVHGGGGEDFINGTKKAVETVLEVHGRHGTTSILPTTLSAAQENVITALRAIEGVQKERKVGPKILGSHLEGNFFSMEQKGAQDPSFIYPPYKEKYEPIVSSVTNIKMITCAPELPYACEFAARMKAKGILMSAGHSDATYDEFIKGVENGISHVTHIYNGNSWINSPYYYCQIGVCEAALLSDQVYVEVIADGCHLPWQLLRLIYKIKGADKINLCTDAMCAAGMPEGNYKLGNLDVIVEGGVAVLPDRSSFAGSVCTADRAVRTMYQKAGVSLHDAVKMMSATPAKMLGIFDELGSIEIGKCADINVFDDEINIAYTFIDGVIYNSFN